MIDIALVRLCGQQTDSKTGNRLNCMGCGGSKLGGSTPSRKAKVDDREDGYDRRPKVSVRIGLHVKKCMTPPRIIFILGKCVTISILHN